METNFIIEAPDAEYFEEKFIKDKSIMLHDLLLEVLYISSFYFQI